MSKEKHIVNKWSEYHNYLGDDKKTKARKEIMRVCGWSTDTFYRKIRKPEDISIAEQQAIAKVYEVPPVFIFPKYKEPISILD